MVVDGQFSSGIVDYLKDVMVDAVDISNLSSDVRERLAQLDLELSEGDITQKGYDKKRLLILGPYLQTPKKDTKIIPSPSTKAQRRQQRRLTRDESRFHSEIRAEAVQQALAEYSQGKKEKPNILPPLKRRGTEIRRDRHRASDSSSEDDSMFGSTDRSKGTSSSVSLSDSQKKSVSNGFYKSDSAIGAPPPDVTTSVIVNGDAIRKALRDQRKQNTIDGWQDLKAVQENEQNFAKKIAKDEPTFLKTDVVYENAITETDVNVANAKSQDYQNAVVRKLI
ncbi:unnamed protein product [Thelazia callipaeda]|uniref:DMAP-interaction domain-containing protein n=1 Tax=Thelazia callipaeda TaxID=103827 RepID=A0A0N5CUZ1_THECL|nr:unnamed protein product [Thelazia callipaeda]